MHKQACIFLVLLLLVSILKLNAQTGSRAYVGRGYGTGVDIIDINNMTKIGSIPEAGGYRMVLSLDGKKLYSTGGGSMIYVSDLEADTLIKAFDPSQVNYTSSELEGIALSSDGSKVFVCDESSTNIFVIDTAVDTVVSAGVLDADEPENAILSPDGQYIYVNDNSFTSWVTIGFVEGKGTTTQPQYYEFIDQLSDNLLILSTLTYRLKQIDSIGSYKYSQALTVNTSLPKTPQLLQNYPNPFNPTTTILYSIPNTDVVTLKVYDLLGREVQTLVNQFQKAGTHSINFNASMYSSGVYFYKLYLRNRLVKTKKMVLIQ
ncbi:MAG: T9SS type A sorting domain-containing protein [bacterium]